MSREDEDEWIHFGWMIARLPIIVIRNEMLEHVNQTSDKEGHYRITGYVPRYSLIYGDLGMKHERFCLPIETSLYSQIR